MERKFTIGDVVRLNSDSSENAPMTVRGYVDDINSQHPQNRPFFNEFQQYTKGMVTCDWRDKQDRPQTKEYNENELIKINQ